MHAPPASRDEHDGTMHTMQNNQKIHRARRGIVVIVMRPSARAGAQSN
jgi:hypothetical protein